MFRPVLEAITVILFMIRASKKCGKQYQAEKKTEIGRSSQEVFYEHFVHKLHYAVRPVIGDKTKSILFRCTRLQDVLLHQLSRKATRAVLQFSLMQTKVQQQLIRLGDIFFPLKTTCMGMSALTCKLINQRLIK